MGTKIKPKTTPILKSRKIKSKSIPHKLQTIHSHDLIALGLFREAALSFLPPINNDDDDEDDDKVDDYFDEDDEVEDDNDEDDNDKDDIKQLEKESNDNNKEDDNIHIKSINDETNVTNDNNKDVGDNNNKGKKIPAVNLERAIQPHLPLLLRLLSSSRDFAPIPLLTTQSSSIASIASIASTASISSPKSTSTSNSKSASNQTKNNPKKKTTSSKSLSSSTSLSCTINKDASITVPPLEEIASTYPTAGDIDTLVSYLVPEVKKPLLVLVSTSFVSWIQSSNDGGVGIGRDDGGDFVIGNGITGDDVNSVVVAVGGDTTNTTSNNGIVNSGRWNVEAFESILKKIKGDDKNSGSSNYGKKKRKRTNYIENLDSNSTNKKKKKKKMKKILKNDVD